MTFENALKRIRTGFGNVDASKLADMAVQVTLTDEDCGGTFYFKSESGILTVEGYDYRDNDAVIDIARKAFMDILAGKATLDTAVTKGLATAKGNFEKLDSLKNAIPPYKAPAKKAVKKAEPKKADEKPAKKSGAGKTASKKKETAKKSTAKK